jgi:hypothetical protein
MSSLIKSISNIYTYQLIIQRRRALSSLCSPVSPSVEVHTFLQSLKGPGRETGRSTLCFADVFFVLPGSIFPCQWKKAKAKRVVSAEPPGIPRRAASRNSLHVGSPAACSMIVSKQLSTLAMSVRSCHVSGCRVPKPLTDGSLRSSASDPWRCRRLQRRASSRTLSRRGAAEWPANVIREKVRRPRKRSRAGRCPLARRQQLCGP